MFVRRSSEVVSAGFTKQRFLYDCVGAGQHRFSRLNLLLNTSGVVDDFHDFSLLFLDVFNYLVDAPDERRSMDVLRSLIVLFKKLALFLLFHAQKR